MSNFFDDIREITWKANDAQEIVGNDATSVINRVKIHVKQVAAKWQVSTTVRTKRAEEPFISDWLREARVNWGWRIDPNDHEYSLYWISWE